MNLAFGGSFLAMNHGLPTSVPSDAGPAISASFGELKPLPPMKRVFGSMPSWRACSRMPEPEST